MHDSPSPDTSTTGGPAQTAVRRGFTALVLGLGMIMPACAQQSGVINGGRPSPPATTVTVPLDVPMGPHIANAMLGRVGYGPTRQDTERAAVMTVRRYIDEAIRGPNILPESVTASIARLPASAPALAAWEKWGPGGAEREAARNNTALRESINQSEREYARSAVAARLLAMANNRNQGHEALLSFWLNHFSVFAPKTAVKLLALDYAHALEAAMRDDNFEALLRASFFHPAMQIYLDNAQSTAPTSDAARAAALRGRAPGLNENLARELLELHTLGVEGGYTQGDIQELARIISGAGVWSPRMDERNLEQAGAIRKGIFLFDPRRHDTGEKRLLGQTFPAGRGIDEIERALQLLATHPATARHVSRKLAVRFVSDQPSPQLIDEMAAAFQRSGGRISLTMLTMIGSAEFAESLVARAKFREPLDQVLFNVRATCQREPVTHGQALLMAALDAGQAPFMRSTPDGYGAREADWLSPAAMAKRIRLARGIATERVPFASGPEPGIAPTPVDMSGQNPRPAPLQGRACIADQDAIMAAIGPLSRETAAATNTLYPRERIAALLASPEAMTR